ncbi:hypothetical protein RAM73_11290 [Klebsiella pneumoniae]|uniref:hypothetical protein n=1 Tax=Enterobacteriaceae TaxID=543 RepID=UPI000DE6D90E|nr:MULTISPECIES: hypothetical protein [Enterobacteriaceae]HBS3673178.1 hypothetical protein [Klebsiella quasipneumoniae subsp. similipneumoniae]MBP3093533.1 hypothetical protein [Klebsiella pneumoniae]MBZ7349431.1 hypothetical protein [Klebsiella michiganensis]MCK6772131.1 hypothetical protein [Enterobacter roggenkampii]MCS4333343.1 hypothetical protein [Klebsiella variicola subsp. variicola]
MSGLIIFIICMVLAVLTYRKVSNRSRNKGWGNFRTLTLSLLMSFIVFCVSIGIGAGVVSQDKSTDAKSSAAGSIEKNKVNVYTCNKFDAITQTRQGTKRNSGYYSDKGVLIEYTLSDNELIERMPIPGDKDSIETAKFNKIADDGSRKYGSQSTNYFVYVMNDSSIKVISVNFAADMTITQICSK